MICRITKLHGHSIAILSSYCSESNVNPQRHKISIRTNECIATILDINSIIILGILCIYKVFK